MNEETNKKTTEEMKEETIQGEEEMKGKILMLQKEITKEATEIEEIPRFHQQGITIEEPSEVPMIIEKALEEVHEEIIKLQEEEILPKQDLKEKGPLDLKEKGPQD